MQKRGIIVSPPFDVNPDGSIYIYGALEGIELRKYLLYWDEIDYPDNSLISQSLSNDLEFLKKCSVLKRTFVKFKAPISSTNGENFFKAQYVAYIENEKLSPGSWSLAQDSTTPHFPSGTVLPSIEFNLFDMLPVPYKDVPLNDILEFKEKRKDELLALRIHLDEVYQSIISANDIPRATNTEISKLELSLNAIEQCMSEMGIKRIATSLRSFIANEFSSTLGAGLGGAGIASVIEMSPMIAGITFAGLALAVKPIISPAKNIEKSPFTYIKSINQTFRA